MCNLIFLYVTIVPVTDHTRPLDFKIIKSDCPATSKTSISFSLIEIENSPFLALHCKKAGDFSGGESKGRRRGRMPPSQFSLISRSFFGKF